MEKTEISLSGYIFIFWWRRGKRGLTGKGTKKKNNQEEEEEARKSYIIHQIQARTKSASQSQIHTGTK